MRFYKNISEVTVMKTKQFNVCSNCIYFYNQEYCTIKEDYITDKNKKNFYCESYFKKLEGKKKRKLT